MGSGHGWSVAAGGSGASESGPGGAVRRSRPAGGRRPRARNPDRSGPRAGGEAAAGGRIETTQEELAAFEVIRRLLGPTRPVGHEDTVSYFKIHLAER